jgi:putative transposase
MKEHSSEFPVEKMCQLLEVSRSTYYSWLTLKPSKRDQENVIILYAIKKSHAESRGLYGLDKILDDVRETVHCGRNRVYHLMRKNGIKAKRHRKFKATTNSRHDLPVAENVLNQNFKATKPNEIWVTDISYIHTDEGFLYLAIVKDLYSKEIVGWHADRTMTRELVIKTLDIAILRHRPPKGLIHHSDRGVQYCSKDYQELLKKNEFICSMSRKGNCYDNACAETFFSTIKNELIYLNHFQTREEARRAIFDYIELFYNRKRKHAALGYMSPVNYTRQYELQQAA